MNLGSVPPFPSGTNSSQYFANWNNVYLSIFEKSKSSPEDEYLFKFKLYCLIDSDEKEQAQLIYDLRKELGFEDEYFEKK